MRYRPLGRMGWKVSEVSFGAWAIGGEWGRVLDEDARASLEKAVECGVNFIDTADVYGDGRSERLIGEFKRRRKEEVIVATKAGRRLTEQTVEGYSRRNLSGWVEDSLRNLSADSLDLLQLQLSAYSAIRPRGSIWNSRRSGSDRENPLLRSQRRESRRGTHGDPIPQRPDSANHIQLLPPASRGGILRARKAAESWNPRSCAACERDAYRKTPVRLDFS